MKVGIRDLANNIMLLQIIWMIFFSLVYSYYPTIGAWAYVPDALNVLLLFFVLEKIKSELKINDVLLMLFVVYALLSTLWGEMNWYYVVSNGRRYITAFIIYFVSSHYMTARHWQRGVNLLLFAQGVNVIVTGYQNLAMKLHPDFCNGIFGFVSYNNAMQGMFALVISVIAMVYFLDKKWSVFKMIYALGTSCLVCAFSEVKAYYVLVVFAFFIAFFFRCDDRKLRKRVFNLIIVAGVLLFVAYKVLETIFPANLYTFFNLSQYIAYEKYGARGGAGRLTSISYIYNNVFGCDIIKTLFGNGLGSNIDSYVYTIGKLFVSFGAVGVLLLVIWLGYICVSQLKKVKGNSENLISIIMIVMIGIVLFVWNALFTQIVFLCFWLLGARNVKMKYDDVDFLKNKHKNL